LSAALRITVPPDPPPAKLPPTTRLLAPLSAPVTVSVPPPPPNMYVLPLGVSVPV
jgi:hypothetical protein